MVKRTDKNIIVGLDIGTSKVVAIVGEVRQDNEIEIIGIGSHPSRGLKKGVVVNIESTVQSIQRAVEEAELMAGVEIDSVFAGIAGSHVSSLNSHGIVPIKDGEVSHTDVERVIDAARAVAIPADQKILHILPQEFIIDNQEGIHDPVGMSGVRLEARVHMVTGAVSAAQNIVKCVRRCGLEVEDLILEQLASSYSVLEDDEKDLGVCLVDIGGGTTDIAVFTGGSIRHTAVIPIAGDQVTNDIAVALRTPTQHAEEIKLKYACALTQLASPDETIEVPSIGDRPPRRLSRQTLAEVVEPRYEELLTLIQAELRRSGYEDLVAGGVVLTGGSSKMEGLIDLAEEVFHMPVRLGIPQYVTGLVDVVRNPIHATGVGLLLFGYRNRAMRVPELSGGGGMKSVWNRMKSWFRKFLIRLYRAPLGAGLQQEISEMFELMDVDSQNAVIKVIGVGGGGGNAINHMLRSNIEGVEFICANTDAQALRSTEVRTALQLGSNVTRGLGAGANPDRGCEAAVEDRDRICEALEGADMVFITAGMGGGTGTGAAPVVAEVAKDLGILTVAVVTKPFSFEGGKRMRIAEDGIARLSEHVDSLITIPNEKLLSVLGKTTSLLDAFKAANDVLLNAVQGIAELITKPGLINVDFADVRTVMAEMGLAMMGTGKSTGDQRAREAAELAIRSPLLEDVNLSGARGILVNITAGLDLAIGEFDEVGNTVKEFARDDATVVVGTVIDPDMVDEMRVTVVATGLGEEVPAAFRQPEVEIKPVRLINNDALDTEELDYTSLEVPTNIRRSPKSANDYVKSAESKDMEYLDIPAFLRRQAD